MHSKNIYKYDSLYHKNFKFQDIFLKTVTILSSIFVISIFIGLIGYIILNGISHITLNFLTTNSNSSQKGILGVIINTIYLQVITLLISAPIGIGASIYITKYKKKGKLVELIDFLTNMLASIPSILFGLFGYNIFCVALGGAPSIIAGCLTLSCSILPIIISTTKEAILSVPSNYMKAAYALGAAKLKVIYSIIIPCAMPKILTAIILAAGKIIGESAALLLTVGASTKTPSSLFGHIFESGRTLTLHLYFTSANATSENSMQISFAIATILIFLIFILNCLTNIIAKIFKK